MTITLLKSKLHRATVTEANLNYVGSITIDGDLMEQAGLVEYEQVHIADIDNGARFETYAIKGAPGSGIICLNGAAARQVQVGDRVIIMCYAAMTPEEAQAHKPRIIVLGEGNKIVEVADSELHGSQPPMTQLLP